MSDKLLPCAHCGTDEFAEYYTDNETMLVSIFCNADDGGCGAMAPFAEDSKRAFKAWNTRTPPEGYVLVPVEPTAEMQVAGSSAMRIETTPLNKLYMCCQSYRAMLSAAEVKPVTVELPTVLLPKDTDKITKA